MTSKNILSYFDQILTIPRESGHEEHINEFLIKFAIEHNLEYKQDEIGNILITKEATPDRKDAPSIILQVHSDMVCEKNSGVEHDFTKDPIKAVVEDGWLVAKDTTLGADCGIGIAAALALLDDKSLSHGKLECLFTISEETGMDGAFGLKSGFLTGDILINLDSEDEGQLFVGCAGGINTSAKFYYTEKNIPENYLTYQLGFEGGIGGHSGDDIEKERSNAVQLLGRSLFRLFKNCDIDLCYIDGGNKDNAIAREAHAIIAFPKDQLDKINKIQKDTADEIHDEFSISDPNVQGYFKKVANRNKAIDKDTALNLVLSLISVPHGVIAMSAAIKGMVETSTNLASVKIKEDNVITVVTSQRSDNTSSMLYAADKVEAAFILADAEVSHYGQYPGWKPKMDSKILEICKSSYERLFKQKPIVRSIHAGLECGLILGKYPNLDMISFGPTLRGVHAPGERLELASLDKFNDLLVDVISNCK
ncbi:MAG: aminoacyl-histidine dipeptidase [Bacteroidales bacterium]